MKIIHAIPQMEKVSRDAKNKGKSLGFVATMGALHDGHLSLIRKARKENDIVVVSIFVNPAQFGPKEDFKRYPRPVKQDLALCRKTGVDFVFSPKSEEMYPEGFKTYVQVEGLSDTLCGAKRPGHFRGVATVVTKLFNIIRPDTAYFGQKDAQQLIILQQMAKDLNMPVKIKMLPIVREKTGLALSSRNIYLKGSERKDALALSRALAEASRLLKKGINSSGRIIAGMQSIIKKAPAARIDYTAIVGLTDLKPVKLIKGGCLIALAVRIGKTRLIDNMIVGK
ncbi:MAG: pantoate--beta-alanine ligase [Candidatus Omnitrophica bacterium]|nr:pantoate--beta-alanine ligase [Candidatus Omnitrophota bacterium]